MPDQSYQVNPGDILLGMSGSIKCSIWNGPIGLLNQRIARIRPAINELPNKWLFFAVNSCIDKWKQETSKLTVQNIKAGQLYGAVIALPPLAEQHRIVARVDELMSLCDQLEAAKVEREQCRDNLVAASLQGLNQPSDEEETFHEHARFTFNNLPRITTRASHIKQLRQTILNLAVRGKLVEQDPSDEPAAELLKWITERKAQMIDVTVNRGRRCKHSAISITDSEKYIELPHAWGWARLRELGLTQTGSSPSSANPDLFGEEIPFIKPGDLDGKEIFYDGPGLSVEGIKHSQLASSGTVLMVCIGATLGKVNTTSRPICFNQQINSLTPVKGAEASFLEIALKSSGFQRLAWSKAGTGTLPIISKGKWEDLPIPLPPLAEQNRIVAKVDELMAICDQLEAQISETEQDSRRFLEALLKEALSPAMAEAA
jgi:type I restriction enzyme S subunit